MKYYITFFLAAFILLGCTNDDNYIDHEYHLEYIGAISADVPDEFIYGQTYRINVTVELPNSCYYQYGQYDYFYEETARLIYPIAHVDDNVDCDQTVREATFSIPVHALQSEPYIFKFYQGEDENGDDMFLDIVVPVI